MVYEFTSRATAPVIMFANDAEDVLRLIGKTPWEDGIIRHVEVPRAVHHLREAARAAQSPAAPDSGRADGDDTGIEEQEVTLRQRIWPLVDMMERAHDSHVDVVWHQRATDR
jgi:hypothetical protein